MLTALRMAPSWIRAARPEDQSSPHPGSPPKKGHVPRFPSSGAAPSVGPRPSVPWSAAPLLRFSPLLRVASSMPLVSSSSLGAGFLPCGRPDSGGNRARTRRRADAPTTVGCEPPRPVCDRPRPEYRVLPRGLPRHSTGAAAGLPSTRSTRCSRLPSSSHHETNTPTRRSRISAPYLKRRSPISLTGFEPHSPCCGLLS